MPRTESRQWWCFILLFYRAFLCESPSRRRVKPSKKRRVHFAKSVLRCAAAKPHVPASRTTSSRASQAYRYDDAAIATRAPLSLSVTTMRYRWCFYCIVSVLALVVTNVSTKIRISRYICLGVFLGHFPDNGRIPSVENK